MVITTTNQLDAAIKSKFSTIIGSKASIANTAGGQFFSLWTSAGLPSGGLTPITTPVVPNNTTIGAFNFNQQTSPRTSYLADLKFTSSLIGNTIELHDRLVHTGGFSGTATSTQAISGFDLSTLAGTANLAERKGDANYSDVLWWLEIYTDLGSTSSNATVNVTYNDGSTGNLIAFNVGNADRRLGRMIPLIPQIPPADQGKFIRGINNLTLSASTGVAGNFGFAATRYRGAVFAEHASDRFTNGWTKLALPQIFNSSCLFMVMLIGNNNTTTGTAALSGKIIYG